MMAGMIDVPLRPLFMRSCGLSSFAKLQVHTPFGSCLIDETLLMCLTAAGQMPRIKREQIQSVQQSKVTLEVSSDQQCLLQN
jgi:hypothetical protein